MQQDLSVYDFIGIGFGPSNLALAIAMKEANADQNTRFLFLEKQKEFVWHKDMMLDGSRMQISFLKDLATLRNPTSQFTFINYLHSKNRLSDFINLKTFYPSRAEFNDYMSWAAGHFSPHCQYNQKVVAIEPVENNKGVELLRVISHNGKEEVATLARNIVLAAGGAPNIPECLSHLTKHDKIFHSSHYLARINNIQQPKKLAVVGAGQSAVEIFIDLTKRFPKANIDLISRSYTLRPSDDSPFVNEIFNPEFIDDIFNKPEKKRLELLEQFENTNYAAGDIDLIQDIFHLFYEQKVNNEQRYRFLRQHEVQAAVDKDKQILLTLHEPDQNRQTIEDYDGVILATGYERSLHTQLLNPLADYIKDFNTDRHYQLQTKGNFIPKIFLQGYSETTHGLSDTLLSVLSVRSSQIIQQIQSSSTTNLYHEQLESEAV